MVGFFVCGLESLEVTNFFNQSFQVKVVRHAQSD